MKGPLILLVGQEAEARAARLEASGYRIARLGALLEPPALALLGGSEGEAMVATLRLALPGVPLLLDIETDSIEGRSSCLTAGADDFWLSTAGSSDLLLRLSAHLRLRSHRPLPAGSQLQVADLCVDPGRRQVQRGGRAIALTAREYELLLVLMRHEGEVLGREQLLREAWGDPQQTAGSNVVEVYVRYLRQKLEEGGERRLIHTMRGRGYCLCERQPPAGPSP